MFHEKNTQTSSASNPSVITPVLFLERADVLWYSVEVMNADCPYHHPEYLKTLKSKDLKLTIFTAS